MRKHWQRIAGYFAGLRRKQAIFYLGALFGFFLALSVFVRSENALRLDERITRGLQSSRSKPLDSAAKGISTLANTRVIVVIGLVTALALSWWKRPRAAFLALVALLGVPLNYLIKEVIGRPRPEEGIIAVILPAVGLSFPSGHAMVSVMFYGFLAFLSWVHLQRRRLRLLWASAFSATAVLIGLSRVYLGAHWFSDVLGGWTAGLFLLFLLAEAYQKLVPAEGRVPPNIASPDPQEKP